MFSGVCLNCQIYKIKKESAMNGINELAMFKFLKINSSKANSCDFFEIKIDIYKCTLKYFKIHV